MADTYEADLLSLGQYILSIVGCNDTSLESMRSTGLNYMNHCGCSDSHNLLKHTVNEMDLFTFIDLITFIAHNITKERIATKQICVHTGKAVVKVRLFKNIVSDPKERYDFYITDFACYSDLFLSIDYLESLSDKAGEHVMKLLLDSIDFPIILRAGYLHYGDYKLQMPVLEKAVNFYKKLGFKNVNYRIGCYENSVTMLYGGDIYVPDEKHKGVTV